MPRMTSPSWSGPWPRRPPRRATLRDAAAAVLAAWDDEANREADIIGALDAPMAALRALLAGKPARAPRDAAAPRKPREGTKQETVLTMLRRAEGATVAQIAEATGWAHHTVRGFFAGLKKKGIVVTVLERVRQVGPNKEGAKGSLPGLWRRRLRAPPPSLAAAACTPRAAAMSSKVRSSPSSTAARR